MASDRGWRALAPDAALAGLIIVHYPLAIMLVGDVALDVRGYLLLVIGSVAMVFRRRAPGPVLAITAACMLGYQVAATPGDLPAFPVGAVAALPVMLALYSAVSAGHRLVSGVTTLLLVLGIGLIDFVLIDSGMTREVAQSLASLVGWLAAAAVMGEVARQRAAYIEQVEQRAIDAELTREETARRRASEERLRIARDLHDSLTHSISVIKVQAGVAVHLARKRGEQPSPALLAIQEASGAAVNELRATLDVLRADGVAAPGKATLDRLPDLLARVRETGVPVTMATRGRHRDLPPEIDQAGYRIVQEALTNVTKHAGRAAVTVQLSFGPAELTVRIDDDGSATPDLITTPGVGLIGMRERVSALGGILRAEPRSPRGFTVEARLPIAPPVDRATQRRAEAPAGDWARR